MDLVINGTEYYVPKKWNEINLKRYISFITTYSDEVTYVEKELHLISTLLGVSTDIIGKAKKSVIDKVVEELKGLVEQPANENLVLEFEIDGIEYGFRTAAKRGDIFLEELSVDIVNAAASFFLSIVMDYIKITAAYSKADRKTKRGALRQMKKVLTRGTAGTE